MIELLLKGVELGIVLALLIGPVFFTIIQTSIERGFWKGVLVAVGVSVSDILYVAICYLGFAQVFNEPRFRGNMAYAGGALLIGFGIYHVAVKGRRQVVDVNAPINEKGFFRYIVKGFLINGMTPMVLLFWIATVSLATLNFGYATLREFVLFFTALLGTVLLTDILKAYLADKLRRIITPSLMRMMNIVIGVMLIFFGGQLIFAARLLSHP